MLQSYKQNSHLFVYFSTSHKHHFREKRVNKMMFWWKKAWFFHAFFKCFDFLIENWGFSINLMTPEGSPWKTASSDVKISKRNDGYLIQLFSTKVTIRDATVNGERQTSATGWSVLGYSTEPCISNDSIGLSWEQLPWSRFHLG